MAKKWLRFHALFYNSLKISLSKNGAWPRPAGDAYRSCSNDALFPLGCIKCIFRSIRDIDKILESCYFFQFGYGHHVPCLRPMAFFHRMSHHKCNTFEFRCGTSYNRLAGIAFFGSKQHIIEHCRIRSVAGYFLGGISLAIFIGEVLEIATDY